jgi:hypothetical protein
MDAVATRRLAIGAEAQPEGGTHFRVWAPRRARVEVVLEGLLHAAYTHRRFPSQAIHRALLEIHPNIELRVCRILRDDGIAVHVVPGRFLKVMYLLFFYPNLLLNIGNRLFRTLGLIPAKPPAVPAAAPADFDNNPKVAGHRYRMFWPVPHGAFSGHWEEFRGYGRQRWIAAFQAAGFDVVRVFKGPPLSGYGLGLNTLRRWARNLGVASAHIFVLRKKGCSSPHETYFS